MKRIPLAQGLNQKNDILKRCFKLLWIGNAFPENKTVDYLTKFLLYAHSKGWLYVAKEKDVIVACAVAYPIKDDIDKMPENEDGDILYVPCCVSISKDKKILLRILRHVLKKYKNIKKLKYERVNHEEKRARATRSS